MEDTEVGTEALPEQPTIYASIVRTLAWQWELEARSLRSEPARKAVHICIDQLRGLADLAEGKEA